MTSASSSASVLTDRAARYGKQLVAHMTRRVEGVWDDASGSGLLRFGGGEAKLIAGERALELSVEANEPAGLDDLEDVVGRHLVRFGRRDELVVSWLRADGTAGTEQRNTEPDDEHTDPPTD